MSDQTEQRRAGGLLSRALRAAGLAPVCVLLPVGAHVLAGGGAPSPAVLLLLTAALWAALLTAPARRSGPQGVLALASTASAGQLVVHWAATAAHEHPVGGLDARMLLAHLAAAALTGAVVARGAAVLSGVTGLLARAARAARMWLLPTCVPSTQVVRAGDDCDCVRVGRVLATAGPRRGPPARERSVRLPV